MKYLYAEEGRWALRDNSMIFGHTVHIGDELFAAYKYHLINENYEEIYIDDYKKYTFEDDYKYIDD